MGDQPGSAPETHNEKSASRLRQDQLDDFARRYGLALSRYFRKRGCQEATVDDLVQEVFTRLAGRASGAAIENAEAYLMRTASSVWRDFLRKRQSRSHASHIEYDDDTHALEDFSAEHVYESKETIHQVLAVLNELPVRTRQAFVLCRIEGMKQKAVAKRLGVSVSSVEKHMVKAIAHLADRFGDKS